MATVLLILLPANIMTMVMYAFRAEANTFPKAKPAFGTRWNIPLSHGISGHRGTMAAIQQSALPVLGYSQEELRGLTFQQLTWPRISIKICNRLKS